MLKSIIFNSDVIADKEDRIVPWWSYTKTITATAILKLNEEGKLDLDKCLSGKKFTYRQLLQHTSGLKDYGGLLDYHQAVGGGDSPWTIDELFNRVDIDELIFEPGNGWVYSNIGYLYLNQELERICDNDLDQVLKTLLFDRADITDVRLVRTKQDFKGLSLLNCDYDPGWCYPGLIAGNTESAARFLHLLSSGALIKQGTLSEMLSPLLLNIDTGDRPSNNVAAGLGVFMEYDDIVKSYGHSGQGPGSTLAISHFPAPEPLTIVAFDESDDIAKVEDEVVNCAKSYS